MREEPAQQVEEEQEAGALHLLGLAFGFDPLSNEMVMRCPLRDVGCKPLSSVCTASGCEASGCRFSLAGTATGKGAALGSNSAVVTTGLKAFLLEHLFLTPRPETLKPFRVEGLGASGCTWGVSKYTYNPYKPYNNPSDPHD